MVFSEPVTLSTSEPNLKRRTGILQELNKTRLKQLDPETRKLYEKYREVKKENSRKSKMLKKRTSRKAMKQTANDYFEKRLPPNIFKHFTRQVELYKTRPKGRRYTTEEKLFTSNIAKGGRRARAALDKIMIAPSHITSARFLRSISLKTGFQPAIFDALQCFMGTLPEQRDKCLVLCWDEMHIGEFVSYCSGRKIFKGFEDYGQLGRRPATCDQALIFFIQGMGKKYKFPVSYYFCAKAAPPDILIVLIREHHRRLLQIGARVVVGLSDQAVANREAIKKLGATREHPYVSLNGLKMILTYDFPHVGKRIVSMFRKYRLDMGDKKEAKIEHVSKLLLVKEQLFGIKIAPKLTMAHVKTTSAQSMRVFLAFQVTSKSTTAGIHTCIAAGHLPAEAIWTAEFLDLMDDVIDSLNANSPSGSKPLRTKYLQKIIFN